MTALPLIALLSIALGFMVGKEHGFKRGVKACLAIARGGSVSKRDAKKCEDLDFVEEKGEEDDDVGLDTERIH